MKKTLIIFFLLILMTACTNESKVDILNNIYENTINSTSFVFNHSFNIECSYYDNDVYYNENTDYDGKIEYTTTKSHVDTNCEQKTYYGNKTTDKIRKFETYNDFETQKALIKKGNTWYQVDLDKLYNFDVIEIDPVYLLSEILKNDNKYLKGDDSIVSDDDNYTTLVSTLDKETFNSITKQSFARYFTVPYDYEVIATVTFNDNYQVEKIVFDLENLETEYKNYMLYEENMENVICNLAYEIDIDSYNEAINFANISATKMIRDTNLESYDEDVTKYTASSEVLSVNSTIIYNSNNNDYDCETYLKTNNDLDFIYFEILYYANDELVSVNNYEFHKVKQGESLARDKFSINKTRVTKIIINCYYLEDEWSSIVNKKLTVPSKYTGPYTNIELSSDNFKDVSNEFVDGLYLTKIGNTYVMDFSLFFHEPVKDLDYTLYLVDNIGNYNLFYNNELNYEIDDHLHLQESLDYVPKEAYLYVEYNVSLTEKVTKKIKLTINKVTDAMDIFKFDNYTRRAILNYNREYEKKFENYVYNYTLDTESFITNYICMIYYVDRDANIISTDIIYANDMPSYTGRYSLYNSIASNVYASISYKQGSNTRTQVIDIKGALSN